MAEFMINQGASGGAGGKDFATEDIDSVDNADDDGIDGGIFEVGRQAGGTALAKENHFPDSSAHAIDRDNGIGTGPKLGWILIVHELWSKQEQLATIHGRVFLGRDDRPFDTGEEHGFRWLWSA
jgi:hypothetical protein